MTGAARLALELDAGAAGTARDFVAAQAAGLDPEVRYRLTLVVSELVTNAVRHGLPPVELELDLTGARARGAVHDCGAAFAAGATLPGTDAAGGRGLFIVDTVVAAWGVTPAPGPGGGKAVWFELLLD